MNVTSDAAALCAVARRLVESWNKIDAQAFAVLFAADAEYVTAAGERLSGHRAIAQLVKREALTTQVTMVGEPIAVCDEGRGQLAFAWLAAERDGVVRRGTITCACVRDGDRWLVASLRSNTTPAPG